MIKNYFILQSTFTLSKSLSFNTIIVALIAFCFLTSCTKTINSNRTSINISAPEYANEKILLIQENVLDYQEAELYSSHLDSSGIVMIEINISNPTFLVLKIKDNVRINIYFEPGYNIDLSLNQQENKIETAFSGRGSQINNEIASSSKVWNEFLVEHPAVWQLELNKFDSIISNVSNELDNFSNRQDGLPNLEPELESIIRVYNKLKIINIKQQHKLIMNEAYNNEQVPLSLIDIYEEMPWDHRYLSLRMPEYAQVLDLYLRINYQESLYQDKTAEELETIKDSFPIYSNQKITEKCSEDELCEFLKAKNILFWLSSEGISSGLDSIYLDFMKEYPSSTYGRKLSDQYAEWNSLSKGALAPNITGITKQEDTLSLSDLTGKIVYIDVWATWCAPCLEELPYFHSLQSDLDSLSDIEFLFLSVDSDFETWNSFLESKRIPKGNHIYQVSTKKHPSVQESYKMWGVPRYILIDHNGKIVDYNAPRPSSGRIQNLIKNLTANL